jgi:hypothetical protein
MTRLHTLIAPIAACQSGAGTNPHDVAMTQAQAADARL